MKIYSVFDAEFSAFGRVLDGYDFTELLSCLLESTEKPEKDVLYVPSDKKLEACLPAQLLENHFFGGMPVQIGYCNGHNRKLNCLEYHRNSELNIAADDIILLLAPLQKLFHGKLHTDSVQAFYVPKGCGVQLFETTLHYAPCSAPETDGFRVAVVLPKGTNTEMPEHSPVCGEDRLLWARNKWLIAHTDAPESGQGAYVGLEGPNIEL